MDPLVLRQLAGTPEPLLAVPQTWITTGPDVDGVGLAALDRPSDALLEAMVTVQPSPPGSLPGGSAADTATTVFSVATVALPALRFARGSRGSGNDRLRVCCLGVDSPSASVVAFMGQRVIHKGRDIATVI